MELRDYQNEGLDQLYQKFREGKRRVIYRLATGAGKTVTFTEAAKQAYQYNLPVIICMRRRDLIDQTSKTLQAEGLDHGVYMANHYRFRPKELVQVCSIDTLEARSLYPHSDKQDVLIIIDESHDCTSRSKKYTRFISSYNNPFIAGFTATPFSDNSLFEDIICPITNQGLLERGYLVPHKVWVPNKIDVSEVRIKRTGAYDESDLFKAVSSSEIIGDFVRDWFLYSGREPTIFFAVNIEHSKMVCEAYNKAGIKTAHIDGKTPSNQRKLYYSQLVSGELNCLTNVDVISTGVDIPEIGCIQLGRPTQSIIWHLQSIGRGLRPSKDKHFLRVIDNAGNFLMHGSCFRERDAHLGKPQKRNAEDVDITIRRCKKCHYVFEVKEKLCPSCGFKNPPVERKIKHEEGELIELVLSPEEQALMTKKNFVNDFHKLSFVAKKRNMKTNWIYYQLLKKYGLQTCKDHGKLISFPENLLQE